MSVPTGRMICPACKGEFANIGSLTTHVSRKRKAGNAAYQTLRICQKDQVALTAQEQPLHGTVASQPTKYHWYEDTPEMRDFTRAVVLLFVPVGTSEQPHTAAWHFLHSLSAIDVVQANTDVRGFDQTCQQCKVQLKVYGYQASLIAVGYISCIWSLQTASALSDSAGAASRPRE
ncbi:TPA: hypothetical protein ACH3X2_000086 [Trebouxia sp. C0005]